MKLTLNVYQDETLTELKRTVEAERLKIPYRVALYLIQSLDSVDLDNETDIIKFVSGNIDKLDKIIKATFGVKDSEMECVDVAELINTLKELYVWAINNVGSLKDSSKNV